MSVLRQFLVVVALGLIAACGYLYQAGHLSFFGTDASLTDARKDGKRKKGRRGGASASPVLVATVAQETFRKTVEAVGTTRAAQTVDIVPSSSGRIRSLDIVPGKQVKRGRVLATLDNDIQRADVAEATAKLDEAKRAFARANRLFRKRNIAEARVIELKARRAVAEAELVRARRRLADRTVRAPFSGRTGLRRVDVGARVDMDTTLTTLDDISSIEVEARISEMRFPSVREGGRVMAESAAFPGRVFEGTVIAIDRRIDPATRSFQIRVRVPNTDGALPAGMFMRLSLQLDARQSPAIPEEALVVEGTRKFVYVAEEATEEVKRIRIEIGQRRDGMVEVVSGLLPGVVIVTEGTHRLRDGAKIKVKAHSSNKSHGLVTRPAPTANVRGNRKQGGG